MISLVAFWWWLLYRNITNWCSLVWLHVVVVVFPLFVRRSSLDNASVLQQLQDNGLDATLSFLRRANPVASCSDKSLKTSVLRLKMAHQKRLKTRSRDPERLQTFLTTSFTYPESTLVSCSSSVVFPDAAVMTRSQDPEEGCSSKCGHELAAKSLAANLKTTLEAKEEEVCLLEHKIRMDIQEEVCFSPFIHSSS